MKRFVATLALCASIATVSFGTVLTFDNTPHPVVIPIDYGSRVNTSGADAAGRPGYNLTHGATPNVAVQMFRADYQGGTWNQLEYPNENLYRWGGYADLVDVAYHYDSTSGARFIFTADAGYEVRLHSFQMGARRDWQYYRTLPFLQVLVDGNPVFTRANINISGTTADTFTFDPNVVKGRVIEIRFGGNYEVGIDNIAFSQACTPNPADVNNDGVVDDADLLEVLFDFGWSCGG
jgi:hypothetical protein